MKTFNGHLLHVKIILTNIVKTFNEHLSLVRIVLTNIVKNFNDHLSHVNMLPVLHDNYQFCFYQ